MLSIDTGNEKDYVVKFIENLYNNKSRQVHEFVLKFYGQVTWLL